jgi:hypothetical protein
MGLRDGAAQRPLGPEAAAALAEIPDGFIDDGCSGWFTPDEWFGFCFRDACRLHDWRYCSRAHPGSAMRQADRAAADAELRENLRAILPWYWRWVGWAYYAGVFLAGGVRAWDSCGSRAGRRCRHGREAPPEWRG